MKKSVLLVLLAGSIAANAQNRIAKNVALNGPATHYSAQKVSETNLVKSSAVIPGVTALAKHQSVKRNGSGNHTQALCEVQMGSAGNQFGSAFGPKTNLWYNRDLNTLTFAHRANPLTTAATIGFIEYDYSTDGGTTWNNNQQYIYRDLSYVVATGYQNERGRYPQAAIYNPIGNTDPANAFIAGYGPVTDAAAVINSAWPWHFEGTTQLGSATNNQQLFNIDQASGGIGAIIPQGGTIVKNTGETWWSCQGYDGAAYDDTVVLSHGVYNGAGDFTYSFVKVPVPVCTDIDNAKMFQNCAVIFNDAGDIGYTVILGNDWVCNSNPADSTMGIIVYKSTNSGTSWFRINSPDQSMVDPLLLSGGYAYQTSTQLDLAVDQDNHLHIALPIVPFQPGNTVYLGYEYGSWGLFDFTTSSESGLFAVWTACLITKPQTYFGDFGTAGSTTDPEIQDENRLQISRSWEGSKIFYTWFDTDTAIFGPGLNNFPDARSVGVDLDGGLWTAEVGQTEFSGTHGDGNSIFGNVSYYTVNDGTNENIPIVIDVMTSSTGSPVDFWYQGCAMMSNFVNTPNCVNVTTGINNPSSAANAFAVSSNYPNPYSGKTTVNVTTVKAGDVSIEITNSIGQLLSTSIYKNLSAGVHSLTIDGSSLSKGLYFYTVKSANESAT
ncbi:MAG: T9SS type A sorting domain-containing protein, partial [Bacteroidota bacterium]